MKLLKLSVMTFMAVAVMFSSCSGEEKQETVEVTEKPKVKIETVSSQEVNQMAVYTANTEADVINNISASTPNRIKAIYVDEGDKVYKGQKLALLDDVTTDTYRIQLANAEANLKNIQVDYDRAVELFNIGGGTKQMVDQMSTQLINAQNAVANAKRVLRNAEENTILTSPISGVVTARNYDAGDMTGNLPIMTIAQVQPVKIVINVSESEFSKIHLGMPATITFDTYGEEVFDGKVSQVAPTVDANTRTFKVEITVANKDNRILPGMFARVALNLGVANHVVVPDLAVVKQQGSGNFYVYVYKDGKVSFDKVELGQRMGSTYELISGVESGAQVVTVGHAKLADGVEVEVISEEVKSENNK